MIHWSTAVCTAFTLFFATSFLRISRKYNITESEAEQHELVAMFLFVIALIQFAWLAYFIYW